MTFCWFMLSQTVYPRDLGKAHQSVYRRNMKAVNGEKGERRNQLGEREGGRAYWQNALECDYDMSYAGHRVRGLPVDSEILVLPEDLRLVLLRGWVEGRGVYLGVECGVDDPAHGASWLWSVRHEGERATSCNEPTRADRRPIEVCAALFRPIMSSTGNGLRSKKEIVSLFDVLRSQLDKYQDTREKLIKVNTQLPFSQNLTHRRFSFSFHLCSGQPRCNKPLKKAHLSPPPCHERGD